MELKFTWIILAFRFIRSIFTLCKLTFFMTKWDLSQTFFFLEVILILSEQIVDKKLSLFSETVIHGSWWL